MFDALFFLNSVLFGAGLAMDAFSISLANGLNEPSMKLNRMLGISGVYGIFQFIMPLLGWVCVHTILFYFEKLQVFIPWIALALLLYLGGKLLLEGIKGEEETNAKVLGFGALIVQGIATSIDALSVGFTIANYDFIAALVESLIIGLVTFALCLGALEIGKRVGTKIAGKAQILGGIILIGIGLEIFVTGVFF